MNRAPRSSARDALYLGQDTTERSVDNRAIIAGDADATMRPFAIGIHRQLIPTERTGSTSALPASSPTFVDAGHRGPRLIDLEGLC
jgi:hypothetical protein